MIWPFSTIAALRAELRHAQNLSHSYLGQFQDANAAKMELARQLAEACRERDEWRASADHAFDGGFDQGWSERLKQEDQNVRLSLEDASNLARYKAALCAIHTAGAASKNGTARKLGRMAREALE